MKTLHQYKFALVSTPGPDFSLGQSSASLGQPDVGLALSQHEAYCRRLQDLGLSLICLPPLPGYPDSCFVEDTCILTGKVAVITRPGHDSRLGETPRIAEALSAWFPIEFLKTPGRLDGGDVIRVEDHFFIGISGRTNPEGAAQLIDILRRHGYTASTVPVPEGLHLKSGATYIGNGHLLITAPLLQSGAFDAYECISVAAPDAYAANAIAVNGKVLIAAGYPRVESQLRNAGFDPTSLDLSEFRKMDGSLTCLSLLW